MGIDVTLQIREAGGIKAWRQVEVTEALVAGLVGGFLPGVGTLAQNYLKAGAVPSDLITGYLSGLLVNKWYDLVPPENDGPYGRIHFTIGDLLDPNKESDNEMCSINEN